MNADGLLVIHVVIKLSNQLWICLKYSQEQHINYINYSSGKIIDFFGNLLNWNP